MKKRFACLALASALLALGACSAAGAEVTVWRAVPSYYLESGAAIESETVRADAGLSEIDAAVAAFNSDTNDAELERPLPDGVDITGWELDGTELKLSVSAEYASVRYFYTTENNTSYDIKILLQMPWGVKHISGIDAAAVILTVQAILL